MNASQCITISQKPTDTQPTSHNQASVTLKSVTLAPGTQPLTLAHSVIMRQSPRHQSSRLSHSCKSNTAPPVTKRQSSRHQKQSVSHYSLVHPVSGCLGELGLASPQHGLLPLQRVEPIHLPRRECRVVRLWRTGQVTSEVTPGQVRSACHDGNVE